MRTSKFAEGAITEALRQVEAGMPATRVCRELGMAQQPVSRWQRKDVGKGGAKGRRLRQRAADNRTLKPLVAAHTLDQPRLQEVIRKQLESAGAAPGVGSVCAGQLPGA
jgi:hypothetical protein